MGISKYREFHETDFYPIIFPQGSLSEVELQIPLAPFKRGDTSHSALLMGARGIYNCRRKTEFLETR